MRTPSKVPHKEVHVTVHLPAAHVAHSSGCDVIELVTTQGLVAELRVDVERDHGGLPRHQALLVGGAHLLGIVHRLL